MIKDPTTIFIGAGAHKYYGFPLGPELPMIIRLFLHNDIQQVRENFKFVPKAMDVLRTTLFDDRAFSIEDRKLLENISDEIIQNNIATIDEYLADYTLHSNQNFTLKKFLVSLFLVCERNYAEVNKELGWYALLFEKLRSCISEDLYEYDGESPMLSLFTFNYDRVLDFELHEFRKVILKKYPTHTSFLNGLVANVRLHGGLCDMPQYKDLEHICLWDVINGLNEEENKTSILKGILSSPLASESKNFNSRYQLARNAIQNSKNIFFLGCGMHDSIMNKIFDETFQISDLESKKFYSSEVPFCKGDIFVSKPDNVQDRDIFSLIDQYLI